MNSSSCVLAIDTSCYTTSLALMDEAGQLLVDARKLLAVPSGQRGLRQSEAVWQHVSTLPQLAASLSEALADRKLEAISFSDQPRPVAQSYLPVFRVGAAWAHSGAALVSARLLPSTHQEGHVWAGVWSSKLRSRLESVLAQGQSFTTLAVHLSGGTSEVVQVEVAGGDSGLKIQELGATTDLHAGQFVDRVGVALGLPFPAGAALEELAREAADPVPNLPHSVQNLSVSFSGPTSAAMRLISQGASPAGIAHATFKSIADTLVKWVANASQASGIDQCLFVGGVASNGLIRRWVTDDLEAKGIACHFCDPKYSTDNAVGLAYYGTLVTKGLLSAGG